jgi:AraC family transcriptional regulator
MTLKIVALPARIVVGLQIRTKPMSAEIPALWPRFVPRVDEIGSTNEPRVSYGVMSTEDGPPMVLHYMAAVSVAAANSVPPDMTSLTLPAGNYAMFSYPFSDLGSGFRQIHERLMPASDYQQVPGALFFERYDERFDPGNPASTVEIYLPVFSRGAVKP